VSVITSRRNQENDQVEIQKDQTNIQKILRKKNIEDKVSETFNRIYNIYNSIWSNHLRNGNIINLSLILNRKMRTLIIMLCVLFIYSCTNTRQSVGITTNPLSSKMEDKTKLQWKITWGKIRPKEDDDD